MNIFKELYRLGKSNAESDFNVQIGIAFHIQQAKESNIMDVIKICNLIEDIGIECEEYFKACQELDLQSLGYPQNSFSS